MWMRNQMHLSIGRLTQLVAMMAVAVLLGACGGETIAPPTVGSIEATVATTGSDLDPDGYTVLVDGGSVQGIGLDGSVTFSSLPAGAHEVSVQGLAANCSVNGANPRSVTVVAGETAQTTFNIECASTVNNLEVITSTTGEDIDADGYTFSIDGGPAQPIGVIDNVVTQALPGDRSVELAGLAANCTVAGSNPRTVTVPANATVQTTFSVTCASTTGSVVVTTATTGVDLDPDGYSVLLDGGNVQGVGLNGSVSFLKVQPGARMVSVQGLAGNCSVNGDNPRSVAVTAGEIAQTTFNIVCAAIVSSLEVVTITTGDDIDADGYTFSIDGGAAEMVGVNDSLTVPAEAGDRSVELSDVANNCTVSGQNPRTVNVPQSAAGRTVFVVSCTSTTGSLVVTTATTGVDLDPDGYAVSVAGGGGQPIGLNQTLSLNGVPAGALVVELSDIANNCTVGGQNPRTVNVPQNGAVQTDFAISCVPITGTIEVITSTTGDDIDPSGYTVQAEGVSPQVIGVTDMVSIPGVVQGDRTVELLNIDGNCSVVGGSNPRTVTVPGEGTVQTTFDVVCVPLTGGLIVTASTTGGDLDPDGYMASVDAGPAQSLDTNGSTTFTDVTVGDRMVLLSDIAPNCTVTGANPATVTIPASGTASHTFDLTCSAVVGSVQVTTATTGTNLDPDGYTLNVEGEAPQPIGINDSKTVPDVSVGDRTVELTGLSPNCTVNGQNPRTVTVTDGGTVPTTFNVTCAAVLSNKIAFDTNRDGNLEIYVMDPGGTGLQRLTNNAARDAEPFFSPTGTQIVFVSDRDGNNEIYVMNVDGTGQTRLTTNAASETEPAWSPDGTKIVYSSDRNGDSEVYVMNADGSGETRLTTQAGRDGLAQWSPNGMKIAFSSERGGDLDIWEMNADGSGVVQLTNNAGLDFAPAYSPNGSQITFTSQQDGNNEIYIMNANGSGQANLTNNPASDLVSQWSPDGLQIAFASSRDGNNEVYVMNANGSGQVNVTNNAANDFEVTWR